MPCPWASQLCGALGPIPGWGRWAKPMTLNLLWGCRISVRERKVLDRLCSTLWNCFQFPYIAPLLVLSPHLGTPSPHVFTLANSLCFAIHLDFFSPRTLLPLSEAASGDPPPGSHSIRWFPIYILCLPLCMKNVSILKDKEPTFSSCCSLKSVPDTQYSICMLMPPQLFFQSSHSRHLTNY